MTDEPIYVTQPFLAPLEDFYEVLKTPWSSGILTHNGPLVQRFEKLLSSKLDVNNVVAVTNGTVAIQMAIKALGLKGEIITTPFSWVATVSAIKAEGCCPVFCDIEKDTFNIDPLKIESLITDKTVAIMPVHVFGNPCDIEAIDKIAKKNGLKVIYDAAHAIGSTYQSRSIMECGDISATSLHSTKILNSGEGGLCITNDQRLYEKLKRIRFFGFSENKEVVEDGFNGKMTEIHAGLGLVNLEYLYEVLADRKLKYTHYLTNLSQISTLSFQNLKLGETNYSYFPVIFESTDALFSVERALNNKKIFPRRYFYPSLNTYDRIVDYKSAPISESVSERIMCLPLYYSLSLQDIDKIIEIIRASIAD